ncbi:MAG: hypothetical protein EPN73_13950 [Paraburkholderia sp.]|uniref:hypothetical protein n=1 Tax=Paraburkholderia sp. TaxID=1926495 RepID=UPI001209D2BC|nr:hypothetical protein [Paraburkholderia sp.]TAL95375.1 MAG: hypothetical protein EPN73_13950 [Paraburkholderia sp.]
MRNLVGVGAVLGTCIACTTPVASQSVADDPLNDPALTCRTVVGEAQIDGVAQQIVGRACRQPDGTWQIVQDADGSEAAIYPVPPYPYYPYYDPWYWGPPVAIGVGASFIFVDHFHHFHHMDHVHFGHPAFGMGMHGGFHGGFHGTGGGFHGMGGGSHGMGGVRPTGGMSGGRGRR